MTESFAPRTDETADTTRHLADGIVGAGHQLLVIAPGPGQASYRGARVVRARRLAPPHVVGGVLDGFGTEFVIAVRPGVLGSSVLLHAGRHGLPSLAIDPPKVHVRAGRTLATSRERRTHLAFTGVDAEIWTPGVDLDDHHPGLRDARLRTAWAKGNGLVIGHVGEVDRQHVVDRLIRIAQMDGLRLVVLGDGAGARSLRAAGAKVVGACEGLELARAIASIDVLVQPRKKEQQVPGVRRALASGVPVVGFDAGGTRDVVVDGHNGLLAHPSRNRDLRSAVHSLFDDDLRTRLAGHARDSVSDRPWSIAITDLLDRHLPALV
ncbi:MAG TPA: glycosyltransferase [Marmoricola sp.]